MKFRFSLRKLFFLITLVAIACAWLTLPTITARRFVLAVQKQDYAAADLMFASRDDEFLVETSKSPSEYKLAAELAESSWYHYLLGRRPIRIMESRFLWENEEGKTFAVRSQGNLAATPFGITGGKLEGIVHGK